MVMEEKSVTKHNDASGYPKAEMSKDTHPVLKEPVFAAPAPLDKTQH